jgi:putative DNA methylase
LSIARTVLFAQLVDDPSDLPELFPSEHEQDKERERLFALMLRLCMWDNTHNSAVISEARNEIKACWKRFCDDNLHADLPAEARNPLTMPPFLDPFSGSGSIPLSAQWLGMSSHGSDLNPVSVLINKCMIEIPYLFAGMSSITEDSALKVGEIPRIGNLALATDIINYGEQLRALAVEHLRDLYPSVRVSPQESFIANSSPKHVALLVDMELPVVAWIWCRTVNSPNPSFSHVMVPLTSTFLLSSKSGKEVYINPVVSGEDYKFEIRYGCPADLSAVKKGTTATKGFRCIMSGDPISNEYIRNQGKQGLLSTRLMAIVADSKQGRVFLSPNHEHELIAKRAVPSWKPDTEFFANALGFRIGGYGMSKWTDIYTERQLTSLSTVAKCMLELRNKIEADALKAGLVDDGVALAMGGTGARAYSEAITVFLGCALDRMAYYGSTLTTWLPKDSALRDCMPRQALSMSWEFAECNTFGKSSGDIRTCIKAISSCLENVTVDTPGSAIQQNACEIPLDFPSSVISTDPPYFDAVGFADLSDYFYVWQRRTLGEIYPSLYATLSTPKASEIVSVAARHGGKDKASEHFVNQMTAAITRMSRLCHPAYPMTLYYAFKQVESKDGEGFSSTGWDTFLTALVDAGLRITGTWPMQTEGQGRMRSNQSNALSSSIVLVCQPRESSANSISRSEYRRSLRSIIARSIKSLEKANTPPVDIAQAVIGPCIEPYSASKAVLNPDDSPMSVREALIEINAALDEYLSQDEGELDADSRFALTFFESFGYKERVFGDAEGLAKARNLSVAGVAEAGILRSVAGKVQLLQRSDLPDDWDPVKDKRLCVWEATQQLIKRLEAKGEASAAALLLQLKNLPGHGDLAANCRALAYRLYNHCEKSKQAEEARAYNGLVIAWPELEKRAAANSTAAAGPQQLSMV